MIAILADIHGNAWALEAVLADARQRGVSAFIDLGKIHPVAQVNGNQDRLIVDGASSGSPGSSAGIRMSLDWSCSRPGKWS
jgi:predicted phosphodiesterase